MLFTNLDYSIIINKCAVNNATFDSKSIYADIILQACAIGYHEIGAN